MIKTYKINKEEVLEDIKQKLDEISVDGDIEIDVDEELVSDLTQRDIEIFVQKAAVLKLMSSIQEDL